ncbi:NADAR family protein [Actinocorallia sp. A-T 12471]|uniref:NADAR family protein n=1 Tax=Actinocorallia sp. A-T 12471 TaxID=3089813 RepID=UPI0029D257E0|nr:NADAR family protein [Actinocorallia sp. A-T 12471]MDX6741233.1 NADAR family protein [Actinocorallia sp. A-T 12471]
MTPHNLPSLLHSASEGAHHKYVFFWGHAVNASGNHVFSQWWEVGFEFEGVGYRSAEHAMMAGKARLFGDEEAVERVLAARHPGEAKKVGREVRGFDEGVWAEHRFELVTAVNVAKFSATPELRAHLVGTGSRVLVEASPVDRIWGIGLAADSPDAADPARWRGLNLLGFALMRARDLLSE